MVDRKKASENKTMDDKNSQQAWQEWELTAFVLDELDDASAARIAAAAAEDARLSAEIVAIRKTVGQVSQFFQSELPQPMVGGRDRFEQIVAQAALEPNVSSQNGATVGLQASTRSRPLAWLGLLAMSASLLLAAWLSAPAISTWMVARSDLSPSDPTQSDSSPSKAAQSDLPQSSPASTSPLSERSEDSTAADLSGLLAELREQVDEESVARRSSLEIAREDESYRDSAKKIDTLVVVDAELAQGSALPPVPTVADFNVAQGSGRSPGSSGEGEPTDGKRSGQTLARGIGLQKTGGDGGYGGEGGYPGPGGGMGGGGSLGYGDSPYGSEESKYSIQPSSSPAPDTSGNVTRHPFESREQGFVDNMLSIAEPAAAFRDKRRLLESESEELHQAESRAFRLGRPDSSGDKFEAIYENQFIAVEQEPQSTFSIDVDTASYTKSRQLLLEAGRLPPADAVRIEEFVNYFDYEYAGPEGADPFGSDLAVASCPWRPEHRLVRIALQATKLDVQQRPNANIVFLLDVSGSMGEPNKLPLVKESMRMLIQQLGENDKVAMVVYAGAAGCVLEGTRGDQQKKILNALEHLNAGGSTNGGQGIQLAYDLARDNFVPGGVNRVILCTDGDFNVGVTSTQSLVELVAENAKSKIFLTVLGFGMGNTNDAMMEEISNRGNGVYGFVDSRREAHRQMVRQLAGNLITVAKDVKIQVEFNPSKVHSYRLLGYENRLMATEDFDNDKKDAGEIGAGHRVTALYEIVPVDSKTPNKPASSELRYQKSAVEIQPTAPEIDGEFSDELLAVKMRYKQPEGEVSKLLTFPLKDTSVKFSEADRDFRWAASMAEFGMLLRDSNYSGNANWSGLIEQAISAAGVSPSSDRQECLEMMRTAARLKSR